VSARANPPKLVTPADLSSLMTGARLAARASVRAFTAALAALRIEGVILAPRSPPATELRSTLLGGCQGRLGAGGEARLSVASCSRCGKTERNAPPGGWRGADENGNAGGINGASSDRSTGISQRWFPSGSDSYRPSSEGDVWSSH
jgi:hypothetical protein